MTAPNFRAPPEPARQRARAAVILTRRADRPKTRNTADRAGNCPRRDCAGGTRSLTHDAAGNVTCDNQNGGGYGYAYNAAHRMESFSINGVVQAEYVYNALGQQSIRRLTQAGQTIHVLHDADGNRLAEYDYDLATNTTTLLREYVWHDGVPVAMVDGQTDEIFLIRTDHIGRPVFATGTAGVKVREATYQPFGGVHVSTGANSDLRFPGQWFQSESGLHQNWMREYDPTTGRYIQADPLGLVDGASVYGYALQNPGRYVDPRGEFGIAGAVIGGGVNFGSQMISNLFRYGLTDLGRAFNCVDFSKVATSAMFGAIGASPLRVLKEGGGIRNAVGVGAVKWWTDNVTTPVIRIGDECECRVESDGNFLKDRILNFLDSFYL